MSETPSTMKKLGTKAPDFNLTNVVSGNEVSLSDFEDKKALLIVFLCAHCPFVLNVKEELARLHKDYKDKGVGMVGISANDVETHPADSPENLKRLAEENNLNFPILYDETQEVAKAYTAVCTPDPFLYKKNEEGDFVLAYRGQLDDSRPGNNEPSNGKDIREALDAVVVGNEVTIEQKPSTGCSIKWKEGNEPEYS